VRFSPDGKADLSVSLPTNKAGRTGIYLSDTDQIVARANDSLQLLQTDEKTSQEGVWKILAPCALRCHVKQSVSRHTLVLYTENANPPLTIVRLSPQAVLKRCGKGQQLLKSNEDKFQNYPESITDEFAYFAGVTPQLQEFTYRWPLCDYDHRVDMPFTIRGRWTVLNDKLSVVNTYAGGKGNTNEGLKVISSDGLVKFEPTLAKHESAGSLWVPIRSSERADRIAVDIFTVRGGSLALDISGHLTDRRVAVYDIEAREESASIPIDTKNHYRFEFDLSPDGHRLAILEDDVVKVVDLQGAAKPQDLNGTVH
jgi:hypothetical protein